MKRTKQQQQVINFMKEMEKEWENDDFFKSEQTDSKQNDYSEYFSNVLIFGTEKQKKEKSPDVEIPESPRRESIPKITKRKIDKKMIISLLLSIAFIILQFKPYEFKEAITHQNSNSNTNSVSAKVNTKKGLNLRSAANLNSKTILTLSNEEEIEIFPFDSCKNGFVKAKNNNKEGYVSTRYLTSLSPKGDDYVAYTNKATYIKSSEKGGEDVKKLPKGARLIINKSQKTKNSTWEKVVFFDKTEIYTGYVQKNDITEFQLLKNAEYENVLLFDISYCQKDNFDTIEETEKFLINVSQKENFGGIIIKVAYRGSFNTSKIKFDSMYQTYVQAAQNVACPFGVYFWTEATTEKTVVEEIDKFSSIAKKLKQKYSWFKLPICIDSENYNYKGIPGVNNNKWDKKSDSTIKVIKGISQRMGGEEVLLYTCRDLYNKHFANYKGKVWIAHYDITNKLQPNKFYTDYKSWNKKGQIEMWQFTSKYGEYKIDANSMKKTKYLEWIK